MQERMEQNREAILQSARELIAQGGLKTRKFKQLLNARVFRVVWCIDTSITKAKC
jgi:DNA-binding transcriptional regulator YbjK